MFVKDYMTRHPVMVEPNVSIVEAQAIMAETKYRHLPVAEKGKQLTGLLTRKHLRVSPAELGSLNVWEITRYLADMKVKEVMVKKRDVLTISPDAPIEDAAYLMAKNHIGCLPVVDEEGVLVGIITDGDILIHLTRLLGLAHKGWRVTIRTPNRRGEFAKITNAIASKGWGIYASGGVPTPKKPDYWDVVVKVRNVPREELLAVLEAIPDQEILDIRQTLDFGDALE
jgi:acetoin utilization protein AcuB